MIFHLNDAPRIPIPALKDSDRVFPGEGIVNIEESLEALRARAFTGPVSLELFNAHYWKEPAEQVLQKSWKSLAPLLDR